MWCSIVWPNSVICCYNSVVSCLATGTRTRYNPPNQKSPIRSSFSIISLFKPLLPNYINWLLSSYSMCLWKKDILLRKVAEQFIYQPQQHSVLFVEGRGTWVLSLSYILSEFAAVKELNSHRVSVVYICSSFLVQKAKKRLEQVQKLKRVNKIYKQLNPTVFVLKVKKKEEEHTWSNSNHATDGEMKYSEVTLQLQV